MNIVKPTQKGAVLNSRNGIVVKVNIDDCPGIPGEVKRASWNACQRVEVERDVFQVGRRGSEASRQQRNLV